MLEDQHPAFSLHRSFHKTQTSVSFVMEKRAEVQLLQPKVPAVGKD